MVSAFAVFRLRPVCEFAGRGSSFLSRRLGPRLGPRTDLAFGKIDVTSQRQQSWQLVVTSRGWQSDCGVSRGICSSLIRQFGFNNCGKPTYPPFPNRCKLLPLARLSRGRRQLRGCIVAGSSVCRSLTAQAIGRRSRRPDNMLTTDIADLCCLTWQTPLVPGTSAVPVDQNCNKQETTAGETGELSPKIAFAASRC